MADRQLGHYLRSTRSPDISILNQLLQNEIVDDTALDGLINDQGIIREIREIFKQYRTLKTAPLNDFLSKSYQQKNNNNLMVIVARSYHGLLKMHLQRDNVGNEIASIINATNIDGYTALLFGFNNAENIMIQDDAQIEKNSQKLKPIYEILHILSGYSPDPLIPNNEGKSALESCVYCANLSNRLKIPSRDELMAINKSIVGQYQRHFYSMYENFISNIFQRLSKQRFDLADLRYILITSKIRDEDIITILKNYREQGLDPQYALLLNYQTLRRATYHDFEKTFFDVAKSGYLSIWLHIFDKRLAARLIRSKDRNGNTPLHLALEDPSNIVMVRFLLRNNANVLMSNNQYITCYSIIKKYADDSQTIYHKGYQRLAEKYNPYSTFLDLLPKAIGSLIDKYIYLQPLPIVSENRLPVEIHKAYSHMIRISYVPVVVPLTKKRDLPYVQKLGGYSYYLATKELDDTKINNPTYIDRIRNRDEYYQLHSQFLDPRPGYQHLLVRIHIKSISYPPSGEHILLVKDIDSLSPTETLNIDYQTDYTNKDEIIGWELHEELDMSLLDRNAYLQYPIGFKVGGYDILSMGKCDNYDYLNITPTNNPLERKKLALSITGEACYTG